jgi:hypothetical protein
LKYSTSEIELAGFAGILKSQGQALRDQGISFDFEGDLAAIIRSEGVNVSTAHGVVNLV